MIEGMTTAEIVEMAAERPEPVWHWSWKIEGRQDILQLAADLGLSLHWSKPIHPGDLYLAVRNGEPKLLECSWLGEACVHPTTMDYAYDFSECVLVGN